MSSNDKDVDAVHQYEEIIEHHELTERETPNSIDRLIKGIGAVLCWGAVILIADPRAMPGGVAVQRDHITLELLIDLQ